jgi:uncharacterized membrane protein YphA (DoxX/SURF4 family)
MHANRLRYAFVALHVVLGVVIFAQSVITAAYSSGWLPAHARNIHLLALGSVEAVLAILLLVPRTTRVGALGLLIVLALAIVVHASRGEFSAALIVYAAGVAYVGIHGPAYSGNPEMS